MIRGALPVCAALACGALASVGPARAQEGGAIRTGEHEGFSRIVLRIDPKTEWSLETAQGKATIFFPGKALSFGTEGVFERMPRTRIQDIRASVGEAGATVEVAIGCDCRVSTSFVGARYLALDVADRDFVPPPIVEAAVEGPEARAKREAGAVASAEQILIQQIERAASQGLIELSVPTEAAPSEAPVAVAEIETATEAATIAEMAPPEPPAAPAAVNTPTIPMRIETDGAATEVLKGLLDHKQIEATTVFDRDSRRAAARPADPAIVAECLPEEMLDVGSWSNGLPLYDQAPDLSRRVVGEFDAPDPVALADLARLYVRFGFGAEAEGLLASMDAPFEDRAALLDLARAVEGRPVAAGGPLAIAAACPGRHGLWLAIGGAAPAFHDAATFGTVQAAFAELPPDLRALVGPRLIERLLDAGQPGAARLIYDIAARPGGASPPELRLSEALLVAAEGHAEQGAEVMRLLVEENVPNSVDALIRLARLTLDANLPLPDSLLIDLRAAALENRHTEREVTLRGLLAELLARAAALDLAVTEIVAARADLPRAAARFDTLAVEILAEADPAAVGGAAYAEIMLTHAGLIGPEPDDDPARLRIAGHLIDLGLPQAALDMLVPAVGHGNTNARLLAARARLRLGQPEQAQATLAGLDGPEAADLRARAFALGGNFEQAVSVLADAGLAAAALPYAWPSGDWPRAGAGTEDPRRLAMASYMATRAGTAEGPAPAADAANLSPAEAFQEPLPRLDRPSLDSARRLLAAGRQVEGFVQDLLAAKQTKQQ